jgi:hypothetical protein
MEAAGIKQSLGSREQGSLAVRTWAFSLARSLVGNGSNVAAEGDYADCHKSRPPGGKKDPSYVEDEYHHIHGIAPRECR